MQGFSDFEENRVNIMSHKNISIDAIANESECNEWNSVLKVLFSLLAIIVVICSGNVGVSIFTFIYMTIIILWHTKIGVGGYIRLLLIPAAFITISTISIIVSYGTDIGDALVHLPLLNGYFYITKEALILGANIFFKVFGAVSGLYFLSLTTPIGEIIEVLRRCHVPELILELMYLIYRFFFLLLNISRKQHNAISSRLGYVDYKTGLRSFGMAAANLLVLSLKKSDEFYCSMESRGYEGTLKFLSEKRSIAKNQIAYLGLYLIIVILILVYEGVCA